MKTIPGYRWAILALVGVFLIAACGEAVVDDPAVSPADDDPEPAEEVDEPEVDDDDAGVPEGNLTVRLGHPGTVDTYSVVGWITNDRLNAQGWDTDAIEFTRSDLNIQALTQNRVQVVIHQYVDPLRAIEAGQEFANVAYVMENNKGEFLNIARAGIDTCEDIDGMRYGIHGETATVASASVHWLRTECGGTGVDPNVLVIPGGENRIIALEAGELDATNVQLADWLELQSIAEPGAYNIIDSGDLFDFSGAAVWVNTDWVEAEPEVATAYIAELLRTYHMVHEDPSILEDAIRQYVELSEDVIPATVQAYLDPELVALAPTDGGTTDALELSIRFFTEEVGELDPGLEVSDIVHPWLFEEARKRLEAEG